MQKLKNWVLHPFRSMRRSYYLWVLRKAQWIVANGLHQVGLSRAERRRKMRDAREVVTVMADKERKRLADERLKQTMDDLVHAEAVYQQS